MPAARRCSECGGTLAHKGPKALTCSDACRSARHRRLERDAAREQEEAQLPDDVRRIREQVRHESPGIIDKVLKQELRPIVREAITEETVRAINELVKLAPRAIQLIADDMESDDALVRQKAYSLLLRYTVGHPAILAHEDTAAGAQINVHFDLPRPDPDAITTDAVEIEPPEEDRECDLCHEVKPASQFVVNSSRCQSCFDNWKATIIEDYNQRP